MDPSIKVETPIIELPNNKNKLFDEEDDAGTSTIPDLSLPSEDDDEEVKSKNIWEYAIDILFQLSPLHGEGKSLKKWVIYQDMDKMEQFFQRNEIDITIGEPHTSYLENSWDKSNLEFWKANSILNLHMLWKYLHHLVRKAKASSITEDPFTPSCLQNISVTSQEGNLSLGDWKNAIKVLAPYPVMDVEVIPSKTPGMDPTRVLINSLLLREASKEKCHNTLFSKMRNIMKPSKRTF